jgi:hypothetical protein
MIKDKPTWVKLIVVCTICLLIAALIGLLIQQFT